MKKMSFLRGMFIAAGCLLFHVGLYCQDTAAPSGGKDTATIDLEQAIRIALSDNPTIRVADMEIQKASYAKKEATGGLLPNIGSSASYTRNVKKQKMNFQGTTTEIGSDNQWTAGFSGSLPLINVPLWQSIKMTEEEITDKLEAARDSKINMVSSVIEAYYAILNAQDSYDVLLKSFNIAQENLRIAKARFDQGLASEYDVIQAEVQVRNMQPSLIATKNGIDQAKLQLKVWMGFPSDYPVNVTGTLADYERDMFAPVTINDVDTTLSDNPTVRQLEVSTRLLERQLKLQKAQWYPTLSLSATYMWMSLNNDFKFKNYEVFPTSTVGVTLSFPIFEGGSRYFKQKQAQIAHDEMQYNMENTKRMLRTQLQSSIDRLMVSIEQISSTKEASVLAEKGLSISQKRYEVGAGSSLELISSENALTQAYLTYYQAIYDYIIAKNDLDKVLGNAYEAYIH